MGDGAHVGDGVRGLVRRMEGLLAGLEAAGDPARYFLGTYLRTTRAVGAALDRGFFEDAPWVETWDVAFADLYLRALAAHQQEPHAVPRPWRIAFDADPDLPPVLHVLLGMNAHINFDLPQATVQVIDPESFADEHLLEQRRRDHERLDAVLASRVGAEGQEMSSLGTSRTWWDALLGPANRFATRRLLVESRRRVWHNTVALHEARLHGAGATERRIADLDALSSARVADLLRPGPVLLRVALRGFGVLLPPS